MTDYEMVYLLNDQSALFFTIFATYITIVFAFLGAGYLFASKLSGSMVTILIVLFSLAAAFCALISYRQMAILGGLFGLMRAAGPAGAPRLTWFPFDAFDATQWSVPYVFFGMYGLAYLGALVFFFNQRHVGLKQAAA